MADTKAAKKELQLRYSRAAKDASNTMLMRLKETCPVGHDIRKPGGTLKRSLKATRRGGAGERQTYSLGSNEKYASFTDTGAQAHPIKARSAPLLVFPWEREGWRLFIGKQVNHPGQTGTKWFSNTMTSARWHTALDNALRRVG